MSRVQGIAVGVPARNEQQRIRACLESLVESARAVDVAVSIVVTADRCSDATATAAMETLAALGVPEPDVPEPNDAGPTRVTGSVVCSLLGSAGAARSLAVDAALSALRLPLDSIWVATTDADTVVDASWLSTHLRWAERGVDGIAGLVNVDWEPGTDHLMDAYRESIRSDGLSFGHRHVHGANLGCRADRWAAVGGCGSAAVGEDGVLWERLRAAGAQLVGVDDLLVTTSGRLVGRAPDGFAAYLRRLSPVPILEPTPEPSRSR